MKSGRYLASVFVLLAVVFNLLAGCSAQPQAEEATPTPLPTPVIPTKPTYKVEKGEIIRKSEFTARISPMVEEEVYFKIGGRVAKVLVLKGAEVKKGQLLAELETGTSNVDVRRAEINLEMAKLNKEMAMMQANKYAPEYPILMKMKDYEVEMAQLAVDEINARVDTAQVKAPFDGTIMQNFLEPDQSVEAFKSVMVIADLSKTEASADLTSADLEQLQEGLEVQIVAVSGPSTPLNGVLRKLPYPYGKATSSSSNEKQDKSTRITITDDPAKANLGLGDLVRVQVTLEKKTDALWLPPQAIRKFEGRRFVVIQDGSGQRRVDVKVGIASDDRVEILDGLSEGQVVVAP
jgi:macrolide-specific efflux system membrane fusion protein